MHFSVNSRVTEGVRGIVMKKRKKKRENKPTLQLRRENSENTYQEFWPFLPTGSHQFLIQYET